MPWSYFCDTEGLRNPSSWASSKVLHNHHSPIWETLSSHILQGQKKCVVANYGKHQESEFTMIIPDVLIRSGNAEIFRLSAKSLWALAELRSVWKLIHYLVWPNFVTPFTDLFGMFNFHLMPQQWLSIFPLIWYWKSTKWKQTVLLKCSCFLVCLLANKCSFCECFFCGHKVSLYTLTVEAITHFWIGVN